MNKDQLKFPLFRLVIFGPSRSFRARFVSFRSLVSLVSPVSLVSAVCYLSVSRLLLVSVVSICCYGIFNTPLKAITFLTNEKLKRKMNLPII